GPCRGRRWLRVGAHPVRSTISSGFVATIGGNFHIRSASRAKMSDSTVTVCPRARDVERDPAALLLIDGPAGSPDGGPRATHWDPPASSGSAEARIDLTVQSELREIEADWKAFERAADCTVFQVFDWLAAWQRHVGARNGTVPVIVLGRDAHGKLLFILQLAIETRGLVRHLTWLGTGLCDYNAPLPAAHFSDHAGSRRFAELWQHIVRLLRTDARFQFDLIDLQQMPETIGAQRNPFLGLSVLTNPSGAHIANLSGDWEQFYGAKRSAST